MCKRAKLTILNAKSARYIKRKLQQMSTVSVYNQFWSVTCHFKWSKALIAAARYLVLRSVGSERRVCNCCHFNGNPVRQGPPKVRQTMYTKAYFHEAVAKEGTDCRFRQQIRRFKGITSQIPIQYSLLKLTCVWVSPRDAASSALSGNAKYCVR